MKTRMTLSVGAVFAVLSLVALLALKDFKSSERPARLTAGTSSSPSGGAVGSIHLERRQSAHLTASCTPKATCHSSAVVSSKLFLASAATPYEATLTITFRYSAVKSARGYVVRPAVVGPDGKAVPLRPAGAQPVIATGGRQDTRTLVFSVHGLKGGVEYALSNTPDFAGGIGFDGGGNLPEGSVTVFQNTFVLEAWRS